MKLGVISALPEEQKYLISERKNSETVGGIEYIITEIEGVDAVFALCGIGKTNSAIVTTTLIVKFGCTDIIFSGVAGCIDDKYNIGDVIVSSDVYCVDYGRKTSDEMIVYQSGAYPLPGMDETHGYRINDDYINKISFPDVKDLKPVFDNVPQINWGKVLTADIFLNCSNTRKQLFDKYNAQAFEMEGASVAQTAESFGVKWIVVRALSDLAGSNSNFDFAEFLQSTTYNASVVTRQIIKCIAK